MTKRNFSFLVGVLLLAIFLPVWASMQSEKGQPTTRTTSQITKSMDGKSVEAAKTVRTHEDCVDAEDACLPADAPPVLPLAGTTIMLDAGHGGSDSGAIRAGINEKDINLAVTLKVRDLLIKQGATVILTRDTDIALTLDERKALIAKHAPSLFLSIHTNAHTNANIEGIEAYYWNNASPTLAQSIYQAVVDGLGERGNWVRKRELAVVHHDFAPAALIEIGYLSNAQDRVLLVQDQHQSKIADSISNGILNYVSQQRTAAGTNTAKPAPNKMSVADLRHP